MIFEADFINSLRLEELFRGEFILTMNVLAGLFAGWLMVEFAVPDRLMKKIRPALDRLRIPSDIALALAMSLGSSRAAAATVASAHSAGRLDERETVLGTLMLSFPGYLRRWFTSTVAVSVGLAGGAGFIYALLLLMRSLVRFIFFSSLLVKRRDGNVEPCDMPFPDGKSPFFISMAKKTLPWGWGCYALVFYVTPTLLPYTEDWSYFMPLLNPLGWSIALAGMAHNTAALAAAGAAITSGNLGVSDAVLALLVGNTLGTLSRVARQNLSFWVGIFPGKIVRKLLAWHLGTLFPLMFLWISIVFAITRLL